MRRLGVAVVVCWTMVTASAMAAPTFVPYPSKVAGLPAQPTRFAPDADGKIVIAGHYEIPRESDFEIPRRAFVGRLTADGQVDRSFGSDGIVLLDPRRGGWSPEVPLVLVPTGLAVLPDGHILVHDQGAVAMLRADGSPETGFQGGAVRLPDGWFDSFGIRAAVPLGGGGTLLAGGVRTSGQLSGDIGFSLLAPNGELVRGYGSDGKEVMSLSADSGRPTDGEGIGFGMTAADGGALVTVGSYAGAKASAGIARFDRNGLLVGGFGRGDGIAIFDVPETADSVTTLLEQPDGRLLATVERRTVEGVAGGPWRLDARGQPDTRFGANHMDSPELTIGRPVAMVTQPGRPDETLVLTDSLVTVMRIRGMTVETPFGPLQPPGHADAVQAAQLLRTANAPNDRLVAVVTAGRDLPDAIFPGWLILIDLNDMPPPQPLPPPAPVMANTYKLTVRAGAGGPFGRSPAVTNAVGVGEPVLMTLTRDLFGPSQLSAIAATNFEPLRSPGCQVNAGAVCRLTNDSSSASAGGSFTRVGPARVSTQVRFAFGNIVPVPGNGAVISVHDPRSVISRANRREIAGTARGHGSAVGERIARVEVAVGRKVGKRCRWLGSRKVRPCGEPRWRKATGTARWRLRLPKRLARGRYLVQVRAIDAAGVPERAPARPAAGRRSFRA